MNEEQIKAVDGWRLFVACRYCGAQVYNVCTVLGSPAVAHDTRTADAIVYIRELAAEVQAHYAREDWNNQDIAREAYAAREHSIRSLEDVPLHAVGLDYDPGNDATKAHWPIADIDDGLSAYEDRPAYLKEQADWLLDD